MELGNVSAVQGLMEQLRAEHAALDARVRELEHHLSLTTEGQIEIAKLKQLKLAAKDRIVLLSKHSHA